MKCEVCEILSLRKKIEKHNSIPRNLKQKIYACIRILTFKENTKKTPKNNCGSSTFGSMDAKYCFGCGRKYKKGELIF